MASIEKRGNLYSIRFRATVDGEKKNMRLSGFKTKKEARLAYEKAIRDGFEVKRKTKKQYAEMTFEELTEKFIAWKQTQVKVSSAYDLKSKIYSRLIPFFGNMPVREITPAVVTDWQISMKDYAYNTKTNMFHYLSGIFEFGRKRYKLPSPMEDVDPFKNPGVKKKIQFWTPEEFAAFNRKVPDPILNTLFLFLYHSGCRLGEALALQYADIDREKNCVHINKSVTRKVEGKAYAIVSPKNSSSVRDVYLPPETIDLLLRLPQNGPFVFGSNDPISERTVQNRFTKYIAESGVQKIRIHDLRHSCASLLISQGNSIKAVSAHLGHSNTEQTLNTYAHLFPQDTEKIVASLKSATCSAKPSENK